MSALYAHYSMEPQALYIIPRLIASANAIAGNSPFGYALCDTLGEFRDLLAMHDLDQQPEITSVAASPATRYSSSQRGANPRAGGDAGDSDMLHSTLADEAGDANDPNLSPGNPANGSTEDPIPHASDIAIDG